MGNRYNISESNLKLIVELAFSSGQGNELQKQVGDKITNTTEACFKNILKIVDPLKIVA